MLEPRSSGVLLPISSLDAQFGIGDLGPAARAFVDFLARSRQSCWQILPLNETSLKGGNSPYHTLAAFSGNILLISPELLMSDGWLDQKTCPPPPAFPTDQIDYALVTDYKRKIMMLAFEKFQSGKKAPGFEDFCEANQPWLADFALFKALCAKLASPRWLDWPPELRDRQEPALRGASRKLDQEITQEKFWQYLFFRQWQDLKQYCHQQSVKIFGDLAVYVELNSVDVWKNPHLFQLDQNKQPLFISGVPPDYFSQNGQLWGHPVYNWEVLKQTGFAWWLDRLQQHAQLFDLVRLDHFRGFVSFWRVRANEITALNGEWAPAPAWDFFRAVKSRFPQLPIIAEDLGLITDEVREVIRHFSFPGMKVLLFAFGEDNPRHPYLPQNFTPNCVVYTGTHDTNTVRGWFEHEASLAEKNHLFHYLHKSFSAAEAAWEMIQLALSSAANLAIIPLQDILNLGQEARLNQPPAALGNWRWRLTPGQIDSALEERLGNLTRATNRG